MRPAILALLTGLWLISALPGCGIADLLDESSNEPTPDEIAEAALAPKPAITHEAIGPGVICPGSYRTFTRKIAKSSKKPGSGYEWHQNRANVAQFGVRLHCTDNLISLPVKVHHRVSSHYTEKPKWTKGEYVRDVISKRSWSKQYEYGLEVLRRNGVTP